MMELTDIAEISAPLPWHAAAWQHLAAQLAADKFPHALLVAGESKTGKSQLALALARLLLCSEPRDGLNCGQCHACRLSSSGAHGDFKWIQPEEKSRTIKIDQVRSLVQFSTKTAGFGLRKVLVLAPADSMNVSAFNALLKSLEEPAAETYLLLVCDGLHNVPATIRSRCQLLRLPTPELADCLPWLDAITGKREESESLLALAQGRPLLAELLFRTDGAQIVSARRLGLAALMDGRMTATEATQLWQEMEVGEFLTQMTQEIQHVVRELPHSELQGHRGRGAFKLLDELGAIQRAVSAGSNPGKVMLCDAILAKFQRELGAVRHGDNIPSQSRGQGR